MSESSPAPATTGVARAADAQRGAPAAPARPLHQPATLLDLTTRLRDGIYVADASGAFLDGNPALLSLFGLTSVAELTGRSFSDLAVTGDAHRDALLGLADDAVHEAELELLRPDGRPCVVLDVVVRRLDASTGATVYHGVMVDRTRQVELERQLGALSVRDQLTGCFNRAYLAELGRRFDAGVGTWGCVYLDVAGFRELNEREGHAMGDDLLVRMSRFLLRQVRAEEEVVRVGADEFLVVLAGADGRRTESVARRLQLAAMRAAPASFALGWSSREPGESLERTVSRASRELHRVPVYVRTSEHDRRGE